MKTLVFEVELSDEQLDEVRESLDLTPVPASVLKKGQPVADGVVLREGYAQIIKAIIESQTGRALSDLAEEHPGTELARALHSLDLGLETFA